MAHFYQTIVFFDLETTGLNTALCETIQLSAVCGSRVFNAYTVPLGYLTEGARNITGFIVHNGQLWCRGVQMNTISLHDLLTSFIDFLLSFPQPVLLAAHNAKRFDAPVLTLALRKCSLLPRFQAVVTGFLDTFLLSKNVYHGLDSYSQQSLVSYYLGETYNAHNALEDARMLQELYYRWNPYPYVVNSFIYSSIDF